MVMTLLTTWMNYFKRSVLAIVQFCKAHIVLSSSAILVLLSLLIYQYPQAFMNLWLTRDQQAMIALQQGDASKAALTFSDKNWIAVSFYAEGDYQQAATLFAQFDGEQAKFSQANALAHAGQFQQAADLYKALLAVNPKDEAAESNLKLMAKLIKKMKDAPKKKELSNEIARNQKLTKSKQEPSEKKGELSNELWLQQVQQNPSKFLRKKFQQEYANEQK